MTDMLRYKKKLIKLGNSRAIVLPLDFLKKFPKFPEIKEVFVEEYPDKLIIKLTEEVKQNGGTTN